MSLLNTFTKENIKKYDFIQLQNCTICEVSTSRIRRHINESQHQGATVTITNPTIQT